MHQQPLIVSFYTNDWQYPEHATRLREECAFLGLECKIEERQSTGEYLQNTCMKPFFIRDCLKLGRPILWIDVDGSIYQRPDYFLGNEENYDFQAKKMGPHRRRTWHVGTMWFNPTDIMKEFVEEWCKNSGACSDESALEATFRSKDWGLRTRDIPPEYFKLLLNKGRAAQNDVICHRISTGESKRRQSYFADKYEREVV